MSHLAHYGTPRHSGRYPWGSGKNPQRNKNFLRRSRELEAQGLSKTEIARAFKLSTTDYRALEKIAKEEEKKDKIRQCVALKDKGYSVAAISERTGLPWSTVKNYLDPIKAARVDKTTNIATNLAQLLDERPYLDVGEGVERQLNISDTQLKTALSMLEQQGYSITTFQVPQASNPTQKTTIKVLTKGDVDYQELRDNEMRITSPTGLYFEDYGETARAVKPVVSLDSSRIQVRYAEDGGKEKDGVIEIRPGVEDLTLGGRNYAQVRIAVDGTHYLKGMAVYGYDMPEGADIVFNTNKHKGTPMIGEDSDHTVLKVMKDDVSNPFGASFREWDYTDAKGVVHQSPINIVNDDEDWDKWKKSLSSQFLSKQLPALAQRQLNETYLQKEQEFEEICSIQNPTLKRQLLEKFSEDCDSAAVHLKAAALPRQSTNAILPVPSLSDKEVFAPGYENGEEVVLVRFPHAGTFEMPRLRVNNNNPEAVATIGKNAEHAIGINAKVAEQLSGADYDGDTVLVIPTKGQNIQTRAPLEQLKDFDPKERYAKSESAKRTGKEDGFNKGREMGSVSNLITDMTIKGADWDEIARAVKHSMVVIDAEKHNLDWKASEQDNGIPELRLKYQGKIKGGASTLISKASGDARIDEVKEVLPSQLTPEERERYDRGEKVFRKTGRTYMSNDKVVRAQTKGTKMEFAEDAHELSSGYRVEEIYADHANRLKALANDARAVLRKTGRLEYNPAAARTYREEVQSLDEQLNYAALNAPRERQAQLIAHKNIQAKMQADPSLREKDNKDKLKKISSKELVNARERVGARRHPITISDREWEAIQAGAISDTKLTKILRYVDTKDLKTRAMPRQNRGLSSTMKSRARSLLSMNYTPSEVAAELGVSYDTLKKELGNFKVG